MQANTASLSADGAPVENPAARLISIPFLLLRVSTAGGAVAMGLVQTLGSGRRLRNGAGPGAGVRARAYAGPVLAVHPGGSDRLFAVAVRSRLGQDPVRAIARRAPRRQDRRAGGAPGDGGDRVLYPACRRRIAHLF